MAPPLPEVTAARALVLDANILLRAALGTRVRSLIERYSDQVALLTPQSCVLEAREYLPHLCARRGWAAEPVLQILETLLAGLNIAENAALAEHEAEARQRIAARAPEDWPVVALAIATSAPVWTEDGVLPVGMLDASDAAGYLRR